LIADYVERAAGHDPRELIEMRRDAGWIAEETIDRDQSCDSRKDREYAVKGNAGRDQHNPVLANVIPNAQQDVLPTQRRNA
jgi:hypothetical protein